MPGLVIHRPAHAARARGRIAAVSVRDFNGKRCLITGAASGIGRATAIAAAREGALLVLTDLNEEPLRQVAEEIGDAVLHHAPADVSDYEAVRALGEEVHAA